MILRSTAWGARGACPRLSRHLHRSAVRLAGGSRDDVLTLAYEKHEPKKEDHNAGKTNAEALVFCHGLFGSKQNWRSISRQCVQRLGIPVYAVDLRNHGQSPHAESMTYSEMAKDLRKFFDDHSLRKAALIGHSMGGKAVMSLALDDELNKDDIISYLISVDMSPARGPLSDEFAKYVQGMIQIEEAKCKSRQEADAILEKIEPDLGIRQFLLTNLTRSANADHWTFRIPIHTIEKILAKQVGDFPFNDKKGLMKKNDGMDRPEAEWSGHTFFVKGERSKYINRKNIPICDTLFPNARHKSLPTGHWVQAEKPNEFIEELCRFIEIDSK